MLLPYYMTSSILKPFISFSVTCDDVTCDCDICNYTVINIMSLLYFVTCITITHDVTLYLSSKSKIKKSKEKPKEKQKIKIKEKENK